MYSVPPAVSSLPFPSRLYPPSYAITKYVDVGRGIPNLGATLVACRAPTVFAPLWRSIAAGSLFGQPGDYPGSRW
jgi:hypothetical protein